MGLILVYPTHELPNIVLDEMQNQILQDVIISGTVAYFETVGLLAPAFWPNSSLDNCILPAYIQACSLNGEKKKQNQKRNPSKKGVIISPPRSPAV